MTQYQQVLWRCLSLGPQESLLKNLSALEWANLFVDTTFLISALEFLQDERWLQSKSASTPDAFAVFVKEALSAELAPIAFLENILSGISTKEMKKLKGQAQDLELMLIQQVQNASRDDQKIFSLRVLDLMSVRFQTEHQQHLGNIHHGMGLGLSLYRTFDGMDEVFGLRYEADKDMKATSRERLYEGAGVGVQSSYSTLLNALREINPPPGSRFIDLGSGYGRAGLVVGLLRPDIDFIGYEYVPHRVAIANDATAKMDMQNHVHFFTQDLADKDFKIPKAEVYYLYDPFSQETYLHVLKQLMAIGRESKITIATKGNARGWLTDCTRQEGWPEPQELDGGNLCLFQSR